MEIYPSKNWHEVASSLFPTSRKFNSGERKKYSEVLNKRFKVEENREFTSQESKMHSELLNDLSEIVERLYN